jgi:hypothetical protein
MPFPFWLCTILASTRVVFALFQDLGRGVEGPNCLSHFTFANRVNKGVIALISPHRVFFTFLCVDIWEGGVTRWGDNDHKPHTKKTQCTKPAAVHRVALPRR